MRFAFLLATLTACGLALLGTPPQSRADIATPRNFVTRIECTSLVEAEVTFSIPGTIDLGNKLGQQPREIWIDLSLSDNDFAPGTFIAAGPFVGRAPLSEQVFRWRGVPRDRTHYYRLNALLPDGQWRELGRGSFRTPDCAPVTALYCEFELTGFANGSAVARFEVGSQLQVFGPDRPAREFWIDLSTFGNPQNPELDNGFPPGTFIGAGPFPPAGATFDWRDLIPATRHYSRVNALHGGPAQIGATEQWAQSLGSRFTTLDCHDLPRALAPTP